MSLHGYGYENTVTLADGDVVDNFETLVSYVDVTEAVSLLQGLGVDDNKLKGAVCGLALRNAGLD